ncbi:MAG TPA: WXG100 family type VII secretion target [Pilimelia sp.]|nr:WXG100 family type VII secretion target [Pilimelia sp.]
MSDGVLVVQFGALQTAAGNIEAALSKMQNTLSQLESDAAPLVASWGGDAKEAYEIRQAKWRTASQELANILKGIKGAVDESATEYMSTEKKNTALFQ